MTESERWKDLQDRLDEKRAILQRMRLLANTPKEANRLQGKMEGIQLAMSFVEEYMRIPA